MSKIYGTTDDEAEVEVERLYNLDLPGWKKEVRRALSSISKLEILTDYSWVTGDRRRNMLALIREMMILRRDV